MKLHFSDGVNDLSKAHYFFTEVERVTEHIVTREIRDNKISNNKMDAGRSNYVTHHIGAWMHRPASILIAPHRDNGKREDNDILIAQVALRT